MARVAAAARVGGSDKRDWSLVFDSGRKRKLREDGFFAGYDTKEELREHLDRVHDPDNIVEVGENLQEYLGMNIPDKAGRIPSCGVSPVDKKKPKVCATSSSLRQAVPIPKEQLPVLRPSAGTLLPRLVLPDVPPQMEELSESSSNSPTIAASVHNFIIHRNSLLISITALPVCIDGVLNGGSGCRMKAVLVGNTVSDGGLLKEKVVMWSLVFHHNQKPRFIVKTDKGTWVALLRNPMDIYAELMNDAITLANFLYFVRKHPNAQTTTVTKLLQKECSGSMDGSQPVLDRLSQHLEVIRSYAEKDAAFTRSTVLRKLFPDIFVRTSLLPKDAVHAFTRSQDTTGMRREVGRPMLEAETTSKQKDKRFKVMAKKDVQNPQLIKASTSQSHFNSEGHHVSTKKRKLVLKVKFSQSDSNEECVDCEMPRNDAKMEFQLDEMFESRSNDVQGKIFTPDEIEVEDPPICILCDDGGGLIYCDGPCQRHFHPTKGSGVESSCVTLGLTRTEVKDMGKFYCKNCEHMQHQCFICGELGSSVLTDGCQDVQRCDVRFCKQFYHVDCVAEMVCGPGRHWRDLANGIHDSREKLLCPRHCCLVCGKAELKDPGMLVQCRRCPKAWHRACLTNYSLSGELVERTIWNHHDREFIYCRNHEIVPEFQTPVRDHVNFPDL